MVADGHTIVKRYQRGRAQRYNFDVRWEQMAEFIKRSVEEGPLCPHNNALMKFDRLSQDLVDAWCQNAAQADFNAAGSNIQLIDIPISNCISSGINKM